MQIPFKVIRFFFVSVSALCACYILDLNDFLALMFFYKIYFSLKKKQHAYASLVFASQKKRWHSSRSFVLKYEKLIF